VWDVAEHGSEGQSGRVTRGEQNRADGASLCIEVRRAGFTARVGHLFGVEVGGEAGVELVEGQLERVAVLAQHLAVVHVVICTMWIAHTR
jgi:hypothetical protein